MGDAAPFAGQPGAAATVIDMPGALPGAPPPNQTLFQQSR